MELHLAKEFAQNPLAQRASEAVRKCVHCGFCNATCPTYQLLGDEADGPRGRIYLLKQMLESGQADERSRVHLDRCLLCRSCETTCPSGVPYGQLLEAGRNLQAEVLPRSKIQQAKCQVVSALLQQPQPLKTLVGAAQKLRPILPVSLRDQLPEKSLNLARPQQQYPRKMLLLKGCVQSVLAPQTNAATSRVLAKFGITMIEPDAGCCGALKLHTTGHEQGLNSIRRLIDGWWPMVEQGVEAIVFTASGCGVTIKDYGDLLAHDEQYAKKAQRISCLAKDLSQVVQVELRRDSSAIIAGESRRVAFHAPCTLQHGLKLPGVVPAILQQVGHTMVAVPDEHLCCGSAGTYSLFQKELSRKLKVDKQCNLVANAPDVIATANIGCQQHLKSGSKVPLVHWIELLEC